MTTRPSKKQKKYFFFPLVAGEWINTYHFFMVLIVGIVGNILSFLVSSMSNCPQYQKRCVVLSGDPNTQTPETMQTKLTKKKMRQFLRNCMSSAEFCLQHLTFFHTGHDSTNQQSIVNVSVFDCSCHLGHKALLVGKCQPTSVVSCDCLAH